MHLFVILIIYSCNVYGQIMINDVNGMSITLKILTESNFHENFFTALAVYPLENGCMYRIDSTVYIKQIQFSNCKLTPILSHNNISSSALKVSVLKYLCSEIVINNLCNGYLLQVDAIYTTFITIVFSTYSIIYQQIASISDSIRLISELTLCDNAVGISSSSLSSICVDQTIKKSKTELIFTCNDGILVSMSDKQFINQPCNFVTKPLFTNKLQDDGTYTFNLKFYLVISPSDISIAKCDTAVCLKEIGITSQIVSLSQNIGGSTSLLNKAYTISNNFKLVITVIHSGVHQINCNYLYIIIGLIIVF